MSEQKSAQVTAAPDNSGATT